MQTQTQWSLQIATDKKRIVWRYSLDGYLQFERREPAKEYGKKFWTFNIIANGREQFDMNTK